MRVRVKNVQSGLHPRERVVTLETSDGDQRMVVHERALDDNTLDVGYPINSEANRYLVELPHETTAGSWRVWVPATSVS